MQRTEDIDKQKNLRLNSGTMLGIVCWIVYFSIYLGRLNFSASMSEMTQTGLWGKTQLGSVAAAFYLAYGLFQFPCGILGDRISAKKMVLTGLLGTALSNMLFPFVDSVIGMQLLWFMNGVAQSMIWPPVVKIVTDFTHGKQSVNIILMLSFTAPAGMLAAYLLDAVIMKIGDWKYCFWSAGIWVITVALMWMLMISMIERRIEKIKIPIRKNQPESLKKAKYNIGISILSSGLLWMLAATFIHGLLKDGLTTWIPTYLTETFSVSPSFSVIISMVIPIVNLSGVYLAGYGNNSFFKNETLTAAVFFGISFLGVLLMMTGLSLAGSMAVFAIVTSMMTGVNTLFISLLPMHFQKEGKVATVTGILNAVTHLGSAVASVLFGALTEQFGWSGTEIVWCLCGIAGVICCVLPIRCWGRNRKNIYAE
ncbi:MAG: MFS transporter [Clostridiales bacterium]|nr:MFS transporter [Clostridiales bacterium]